DRIRTPVGARSIRVARSRRGPNRSRAPWCAQLREGGEDGPGRFQVRRLESLGERGVDLRENLPGLLGLSPPLPETREAGGRAQVERARLLSACGLQRFPEASLRGVLVRGLLDQAQLALHPEELGLVVPLAGLLHGGPRLAQRGQPFGGPPERAVHLCE